MEGREERGLRLLLIGFGNVGQKIGDLLSNEADDFPALSALLSPGSTTLQIMGIVTRRGGALVAQTPGQGVDVARAVSEMRSEHAFSRANPDFVVGGLDGLRAAAELNYDVLVELSTLNIERGGEPALSYVRTALKRRKHVVSANKGPLAYAGKELISLAQENQVKFLNECCVMDGCPIFNMTRSCFRGTTVLELKGVLNSTTNFILSAMESGDSFDCALKAAQQKGFAEADPSHDVQGWDAAAKIAVLANTLMGGNLRPDDVKREGIEHVTAQEAMQAKANGKRLRLICRAMRNEGQAGAVTAQVQVEELDESHQLATVAGSGSTLGIKTDLMTTIYITQEEPTLYDTAYGVLTDLISLIEDQINFTQ